MVWVSFVFVVVGSFCMAAGPVVVSVAVFVLAMINETYVLNRQTDS